MGNVGSTCVTGSVRPVWSAWVLQLIQSTRRSPAYLTSNRTFCFFARQHCSLIRTLRAMWRGAEGSLLRTHAQTRAANYIMVRSGAHVRGTDEEQQQGGKEPARSQVKAQLSEWLLNHRHGDSEKAVEAWNPEGGNAIQRTPLRVDASGDHRGSEYMLSLLLIQIIHSSS